MSNIELFEYSISELMENISERCHDGCILISCYRDEGMPKPKEGMETVMTAATGFANNNEIMKIMVTLISEMVDEFVENDDGGSPKSD